jgi:DNA-binding NarL/FixJ family response regulator
LHCPFRIVLVDEHQLARQALKMIIESDERFVVVAEADTAMEALSVCNRIAADLAVVDPTISEGHGVWLARQLTESIPALPIMMLANQTNPTAVHEAINAGASAYVSKKITRANLLLAFEHVLAGGNFIQPILRNAVLPFVVTFPKRFN